MVSRQQLKLESIIGVAHRAAWTAQQIAGDAALYGLQDDLWRIAQQLSELQEALLVNAKRLRETQF